MFSIYLITNTQNGKVYVGQTCKTIEQRWKGHIKDSNAGRTTYLCNAIRKHGNAVFTKERLALCLNKKVADIVEKFFIKQMDSQNTQVGYNLLDGGGGASGYKHTEQWKAENSRRTRGRVLTQEWKQKIGDAQRGRTFTEEHKIALRNGQLGKSKTTRSPEHCAKISANKKAWWASRKELNVSNSA